MRREVPLLLTFLFGLFYVLSNFIVWKEWRVAAENINNWVFIIIAFTYVLGVGNVLRIHGLKVSRLESGWAYSAATIAGLLVMIFFGIVLWFLPVTEGDASFRFRVLQPVVVDEAVHASPPAGTGDAFDLSLQTRLAVDANKNKKADPGDELECRLHYSYLGGSQIPRGVFSLTYDTKALEPVAGGSSGTAGAPPPPGAAGSAAAAAPAVAALPAGVQTTPAGLTWDAGPIGASLFGRTGAGNSQSSVYTWFYDAIYVPMQSTMYALLAFFISSAAFRAFRLRSLHAVLLGVTALVVILGSVPVGEAVWGHFPSLVAWVMNCLQTAGKRAILIGAALGAIATGMKMIVGTEKGYLGRD